MSLSFSSKRRGTKHIHIKEARFRKSDLFDDDYNNNQRTNGPENAHLISGPTVSTKTSFANFDIVLKWVKVNSGSLFK